MPEGKTGHRRQRNPGQRNQHQAVAGLQFALEAPGEEPQNRAQDEGRKRGYDERPERVVERPHRHDQRREHGHREHHHDEGEDVRDRQ